MRRRDIKNGNRKGKGSQWIINERKKDRKWLGRRKGEGNGKDEGWVRWIRRGKLGERIEKKCVLT